MREAWSNEGDFLAKDLWCGQRASVLARDLRSHRCTATIRECYGYFSCDKALRLRDLV